MRYYPHDDRYRFWRLCCCFTIVAVLLVVVVVIFLVLVVLKPKKPEFALQDARVNTFRLEEPQAMTTSGLAVLLSLDIALTVAAQNPNKVGIRYSAMRIVIYYREYPMGLAMVPAFYQPAHSATLVQARLLVNRVNILEADALNLVQDVTSGVVRLRLAGKVPAQITILGVDTSRLQVGISCEIDVSPRQQQLLGKQCGVKNVDL